MSNLHLLLDESNLHAPKGFTLVGNKTRPWKNELGQAKYTEDKILPKAINFVDGTLVAPTVADGDIYVLIGSGTIHASWGTSTFGDWTRALNTIYTPITPLDGDLCFDTTALSWMEYNTGVWAAFGAGTTNLSEGTSTTTTVDVDSSTGTNATLLAASTSRAGLMTKAKFDEVVVNNAKVSFPEAPNDGQDYVRNSLGWSAFAPVNLYNFDGALTSARLITANSNVLTVGGNTAFGTTFRVSNSNAGGQANVDIYNNLGNLANFIATGSSYSAADYRNNFFIQGSPNCDGLTFRMQDSTSPIRFLFGNALSNVQVNGKWTSSGLLLGQGIGGSLPNAQLHVKGSGSTSGTTAFLAENLAGTTSLAYKNDGSLTLSSNANLNSALVCSLSTGRGVHYLENDTGAFAAMYMYGSAHPDSFFQNRAVTLGGGATSGMTIFDNSATDIKFGVSGVLTDLGVHMKLDPTGLLLGNGIGASSPSAKLHVIGSTLLNGNLGVFGATPIAQPTTAIIAPAVVSGGGTTMTDTDTVDGYTYPQAIKALRNLGILA